MPRGAKKGERRGGRQKGTVNKLTGDIKAAIQAAFEEAGGKEYLVKLATSDPRTFCSLVGKLVPVAQDVNLNVTHYDQMDEDQLREYIEQRVQVLQLLEHGGTEH